MEVGAVEATFEMRCKPKICKQLQTVRGIFSLQARGSINQQTNLRGNLRCGKGKQAWRRF